MSVRRRLSIVLWLALCVPFVHVASLLASDLADDDAGAALGHRVFGATTDNRTLLLDSTGVVTHVWTSAFDAAFPNHIAGDGALLRGVVTTGFPVGGATGGLQRVALDGTVLWDFRYDGPGQLSHHDIAELPNGNVLLIAWEEKTREEAIAAGRDPSILGDTLLPEHIIEVEQTSPTRGEIVWEWYLWDHLIQDFDPTKENFGVVGEHPELVDLNYPRATPPSGDWNHANGIFYDPASDRIFLSVNRQHEIWAIDHSTTTEEAAGHTGGRWGRGGDLLYRWGNPVAYRAGSNADRVFFGQHSPRVIPPGYPGEGNLLVFANNQPDVANRSAIYELVLPVDGRGRFVLGPGGRFGPEGPVWQYDAPGFYSSIMSSVERLPNGNTLIASASEGRVFEIDTDDEIVVEWNGDPDRYYMAQYVERWLWTDRLKVSQSAGDSATLDLIAGTPFAGMNYQVLGSRSGTEPGTQIDDMILPLNRDEFSDYTLKNPNSEFLVNSSGTLDSLGKAQMVFHLVPDSPFEVGDELHFAFFLTEPDTDDVIFVSNAAPISVVE